MPELWVPWAVRIPGPDWKFGYSYTEAERYHHKRGFTCHSSEGYISSDIEVIKGPRQTSFQLEGAKSGALYQFYPLTADCWHSGDADDDGGVAGNIDTIGYEMEGFAGEALTEGQYQTLLKTYRWCASEFLWPAPAIYPWNGAPGEWAAATLFPHQRIADKYTACPSGRWPLEKLIRDLRGEPVPDQLTAELYVHRVRVAIIKAIAEGRFEDAARAMKVYLGINV